MKLRNVYFYQTLSIYVWVLLSKWMLVRKAICCRLNPWCRMFYRQDTLGFNPRCTNPVLKCTCSAQDKKVYLQKVPNTTLYYYLKYNLLNIQWFLVGTKRLHIKGLVHYVYSSTFCSNVCSNTHILIQSWNGDYLSYVLVPLNNDPMFCFSLLKQGALQ